MKNFLKCIVLIFTIIMLNACTITSTGVDKSLAPIIASNNHNPFFFHNNESEIEYHGIIDLFGEEWVKCDVKLKVNYLGSDQNGSLYSIKIDYFGSELADRLADYSNHFIDYYDEHFNLGYLFVEADKIYKYASSYKIEITSLCKAAPPECYITCQDEELIDLLDGSEKGWHTSVFVDNDQRRSSLYNTAVETGYHEFMTWKKDVGLIYYESGYGAGRQRIELRIKGL